jgi:hypothetical protein
MARPKGMVITKKNKGSDDAETIQSEIDALSQKIQEKGNIKEVDDKIIIFACPRCGETSKNAFYPSYNKINKVSKKTIYCKKCINEIYAEALMLLKNDKMAIINICQILNIPFDERVFNSCKELEDEESKKNLIESYIEKISIYKDIYEIGNSYLEGDSFLIKDSIITLDDYKQYQENIDKQKEYLKQSKKTDEAIKRNREDVIRIVGADPFSAYPEDEAAELYASLLDFLDEDIDPPRFLLNIYIEIIKNFYLLDKINEEMLIQTSDSENLFANAKQIKTLNDTKTNIQNTINKIAADNQISLKTAKDKGDKTKKFTYIIRKLMEYEDLDDVKSNVFDVKTSKAMAEVEKQSFGNMISQLNIEENDYINVLANQRDRIAELESELLKIKEKNRAKTKRISKLEERLKNLSEKNEEQDD